MHHTTEEVNDVFVHGIEWVRKKNEKRDAAKARGKKGAWEKERQKEWICK